MLGFSSKYGTENLVEQVSTCPSLPAHLFSTCSSPLHSSIPKHFPFHPETPHHCLWEFPQHQSPRVGLMGSSLLSQFYKHALWYIYGTSASAGVQCHCWKRVKLGPQYRGMSSLVQSIPVQTNISSFPEFQMGDFYRPTWQYGVIEPKTF